jgi:hypothetical protein
VLECALKIKGVLKVIIAAHGAVVLMTGNYTDFTPHAGLFFPC